MRYLMVSTYPPTHCGIGAYGEQSVTQLRGQGHVVDVASPDGQGNVDFAWDLRGGWKLLQLFRLLPYYDRAVVQYHWAFFYTNPFRPENRWDTLKTNLSFLLLFIRFRKVEVVAHEVPYLTGRGRWLYAWMWRLAPKVVMHTQQERHRFEQHYRIRLADSNVEIREHHQVFQSFTDRTQISARHHLGQRPDCLIFLCIGFIQRHKGFDRAIQAFVQADLPASELYVVGSLRVADGENQAYLAELYHLAEGHPNVHVVESFISNEEFDEWITASDWVLFPYSEVWSSGVLARTRLLQRPAIVSAVGGLPDQTGDRDILFTTDGELVSAFLLAASRQLPRTANSK